MGDSGGDNGRDEYPEIDAPSVNGSDEGDPKVGVHAESGREENDLEVDASAKNGRDENDPEDDASAENGRDEDDPEVDASAEEKGRDEDDPGEVDAAAEEEKVKNWDATTLVAEPGEAASIPRITRTGTRLFLFLFRLAPFLPGI